MANAATIQTGANVFSYLAADAPAGVPCSSGCTVTIPALSQRIMWYRVKYRDAGNSMIAVGPAKVTAAP